MADKIYKFNEKYYSNTDHSEEVAEDKWGGDLVDLYCDARRGEHSDTLCEETLYYSAYNPETIYTDIDEFMEDFFEYEEVTLEEMKEDKYNDVPFAPCNDCSNCESCQAEAYEQGKKDAQEECERCIYSGKRDVRAETLKEISRAMYHECFEVSHEEDGLQKWDGGNWFRYKLFENVMDRLKEQKK